MPLGLLSLAATLRIENYLAQIYQPKFRLIQDEDYKKTAFDVLRKKPSLIGFSTWCISYPASLLLAKELKALAPEKPIIFGGPQASILATETLEKFAFIDYVLCGESDYTFPQLVKELNKDDSNIKDIPGLVYRDFSGNICQNKQNQSIQNLNELPVPAYDLISGSKSLSLDVGRGCPFNCTYCSTNDFFSKKYRVKSTKRIISEMLSAFEKWGIKSFSFAHDMFTFNKKFILELCKNLISIKEEKGINFTWTCSARIDCISNDMLVVMKKAGCQSIFFGIESGSDKIQKSIRKNLKVDKAYELADICRHINIKMHASFIVGFPDETKSDLEQTLQIIFKLAFKGVFTQISELSLLPGTPLFNNYVNQLKLDGSFSNFSQTVCGPAELQLIQQYPKIFSSFYYLPVSTLKRKEMVFLCQFINKQSQFRNTLFLIGDLIVRDSLSLSLIDIFIKYFHKIKTEELNIPIVSHWVSIIKNHLKKSKKNISNPIINDVFTYESYLALLKAVYNRWHLFQLQSNCRISSSDFNINPTPVWRILTTSYKIEKILPSENNWDINHCQHKKGIYKYLVTALSETDSNYRRINSKEEFLLFNLSKLSFQEYVKKVITIQNEHKTLLWIKKMNKLGVVEFSEIQNNKSK